MIVRAKTIDSSIIAALLDECEGYDKVNVLLTEEFDCRIMDLLNMLRDKIGALIVVQCKEWADHRLELNFCPQAFYIIRSDEVDAEKFSRYV